MRKLNKLDKPQILVDNAVLWTQEYCDCLKEGKTPSKEIATRYNEDSIKSTLEKETHEKCAYCESKMKHISYGDIEHILPKNKDARPDLYVEWSNLTLACEQCNRSGKRMYYNPELPLINPYLDEPSEHLIDMGPIIMPVIGDDRAYVTKEKLKLNRAALVECRNERISSVENLLNAWKKEPRTEIKNILEEQLHNEYSEDKEFTSTVKSYLRQMGFPIKDKQDEKETEV